MPPLGAVARLGLAVALLAAWGGGCSEAPPTPYVDLGTTDGGVSLDGGGLDATTMPDSGASPDAGGQLDSGGPDAFMEVDAGRTMATGEPRLVIVDLTEGAEVEWRDGFGGAGQEIPIGTDSMSDPIPNASGGASVSLLRSADDSVLYTQTYPAFTVPPLELLIAFGNIPEMGWATNAFADTTVHLEPSDSRTSVVVSNGYAMSLGGWDITIRSPATSPETFTGVTFGNSSGAVLVSRTSVVVELRYFIQVGVVRTHRWCLPPLDEDRYNLVIMGQTSRAWLVGGSVPTLTELSASCSQGG